MEATLREFLDHAPVLVRRPDGEILYWTEGSSELFGYSRSEAEGRDVHALLKTVFAESREAIDAALQTKGEWTGRLRQTTKSGRSLWTLAVLRLRDRDASAGPVVVEQNTDISAHIALEEQRDLLARELEHRVKNLLTIAQALARNSFPDADPRQLDKFQKRLAALGDANRLLREGSWDEADIRQLVKEVARALGIDERLRLEGPRATIGSEQATGFALAVHELCTNALKYGALSAGKGYVSLTWSVDPDGDHVAVRWAETGGPPPAPQRRAGFGSRLIQRAIPGRAPVALRFEPEGAVCEMRLSLGSATRLHHQKSG